MTVAHQHQRQAVRLPGINFAAHEARFCPHPLRATTITVTKPTITTTLAAAALPFTPPAATAASTLASAAQVRLAGSS